VPIMVYYPIPLALQTGYKHYPSVTGGIPMSEDLSNRVMSVPMHPYLDIEQQDYIISVVQDALKA
jgi:dTDP-4-amino-4,6-dideoxygalactose transaminase